jgi:hypothetical protein
MGNAAFVPRGGRWEGTRSNYATRALGGRAFLRATSLGKANIVRQAKYSGGQEWPPSDCATRDLGGRASLRAMLRR